MADTPQVFVICGNNCRYEGMTKEQILTAIYQAIQTGNIGNCDTGFITTIKTINGKPLKFFVGEQAAYDALTKEQQKDVFAIITNDTTKEELLNTLETLRVQVTSNDTRVNELYESRPYTLSGFKDGNARLIKDKFDINTLNSVEHCNVYVLHHDALAWGKITGLPDDLDIFTENSAKLIVEADCDETANNRAIYHTLKVNASNGKSNLLIYHRIYHPDTKEFEPWRRFVSAEELETGEITVSKAKIAESASTAISAHKAKKAETDINGNSFINDYAKVGHIHWEWSETEQNYRFIDTTKIGTILVFSDVLNDIARTEATEKLAYMFFLFPNQIRPVGEVLENLLYCDGGFALENKNSSLKVEGNKGLLGGKWAVRSFIGFGGYHNHAGDLNRFCTRHNYLIQRIE